MTPMTLFEPRPLRLGQLLDEGVRLYRRNFLKLVGIVALVQIPIFLLTLLLNSTGGGWEMSPNPFHVMGWILTATSSASTLLPLGFNGILPVLSSAAVVRFLADQRLGSSTGGVLEAYRGLRPVWKGLLAALLFSGLIQVGLIAMILPCFVGFPALGAIFFFSLVVQPLMVPIAVLEQQRARAILRRAWDLARRRFWPLSGFAGLLYLLNQIFSLGLVLMLWRGLTFAVDSFSFMDTMARMFLHQVVLLTIGLLAGLIFAPLQATAFYAVYIDLRVRLEGFDLAWKAQALEEPGRELVTWPAAPVPAKDLPITKSDIGNLVLLTLGFFAFTLLVLGLFFLPSLWNY